MVLKLVVVQLGTVGLVRFADDAGYLYRLQDVFLSAGIYTREVEDVLYQIRQASTFATDDSVVFLPLVLGSRRTESRSRATWLTAS